MPLRIATCQFPVAAHLQSNLEFIRRQAVFADGQGAEVIHFPEGALSGYAGIDFASFEDYDWVVLDQATRNVRSLARELGLWFVLGTAHRLGGGHKPHNSLLVIDDAGEIVDRYDKRFCAGDATETTEELAHFTPGDHLTTFEIEGIRCGVLICHEYRYPELYRQLMLDGVQLVFHSFHAGNVSPQRWREMQSAIGTENAQFHPFNTLPGITMPAGMIASASNNYLWISCSNSSARESCWPAFVVRPDGVITGRLKRNVTGVLISTIDPEQEYYDSTKAWRKRAVEGQLHSGTLVDDERSIDRKNLS